MIGDYIKKLAKREKVSNRTLCKILGCDIKDIQKVFNGTYMLSLSQLELLAEYFGINCEEILKGAGVKYEKIYALQDL